MEYQGVVLSPLQEPGKGKDIATAMTSLREASGQLEVKGTGFREGSIYQPCDLRHSILKLSSSLSFDLHDGIIRSASQGCCEDSAWREHPLVFMMILATAASTGKALLCIERGTKD